MEREAARAENWPAKLLIFLAFHTRNNFAKVGVVGSNPIARSKILDLIEGSAVTT